MFRPRGVVYPIGVALPCMTNVLTRPVARVSCSTPPLPEKTWNRARLPSGDQATSSGAVRKSGHRASWYLAPPGLTRYSVAGPVLPPSGAAVVYWASTQPGPTWLHGTPAGWALVTGSAVAAVPVVSRAAVSTPALSTAVAIAVRGVRRSLMPS
jgi:hypothetical protein